MAAILAHAFNKFFEANPDFKAKTSKRPRREQKDIRVKKPSAPAVAANKPKRAMAVDRIVTLPAVTDGMEFLTIPCKEVFVVAMTVPERESDFFLELECRKPYPGGSEPGVKLFEKVSNVMLGPDLFRTHHVVGASYAEVKTFKGSSRIKYLFVMEKRGTVQSEIALKAERWLMARAGEVFDNALVYDNKTNAAVDLVGMTGRTNASRTFRVDA